MASQSSSISIQPGKDGTQNQKQTLLILEFAYNCVWRMLVLLAGGIESATFPSFPSPLTIIFSFMGKCQL